MSITYFEVLASSSCLLSLSLRRILVCLKHVLVLLDGSLHFILELLRSFWENAVIVRVRISVYHA